MSGRRGGVVSSAQRLTFITNMLQQVGLSGRAIYALALSILRLVEKASQITPWAVPHLLHNADCKIRVWRMDEKMDFLVRNSDGDELLFIHQGSADLYCDYGHLEVSEGDYVMIPRSTNWRLESK